DVEVAEGKDAGDDERRDQDGRERGAPDAEFSKAHLCAPSFLLSASFFSSDADPLRGATRIPLFNPSTPSATMVRPGSRPSRISTFGPSRSPSLTSLLASALFRTMNTRLVP